MALRGNLKELSLPDIFQLVTFSGKTGVLRIRRDDDAQGSVWFREGEVFFAQSNWHTELLGERLARAQRITPMALERALDLRSAEPAGGKRLGEILIEQGYITEAVLEAFVQEQMQDTIFDLMRWDEGDFEFEAMPEAPAEDIGLSVSIENVIMEGSRRLEEWNRIKRKIPSTDVAFKMATAPGEGTFEISLKPMEWNLLLLIDGSRSVAELAHETNRTDFEVARIVYGLFSAGLLEFASEDEITAARSDRTEREARFAEFEAHQAELRAAEEAAKPQPEPVVEPVVLDYAEPSAVATAVEASPEATSVAATTPSEPVEEPQFLGGEPATATAEDLAALEAAMGALLSAPPLAAPARTAPVAAPYTPGEEPAFIAASHENQGSAGAMAVPSVEELLGDIADLTPARPLAETPAEPVEPAIATQLPSAMPPVEVAEPEALSQVAPEVIEMPEPEPAPAAPEPEPAPAAPEPELTAVAPEPEPAAIAPSREIEVPAEEPSTLEDLVFLPVTAPPAEPTAAPATAPLEPGSFVIVPGVVPRSAEPEPLESLEPEPPVEAFASTEPAAPEPETAPSASVVPGLGGFENDLMALGLGELPPELLEPVLVEQPHDLEPVVEPMGVTLAAAAAAQAAAQAEELASESISVPVEPSEPVLVMSIPEATEPLPEHEEVVDFSALLQSLDISADDAEAEIPSVGNTHQTASSIDRLLDLEPAVPSSGVISTDAFLEDLSLDDDFSFSGELNNELSALTGADRHVRPSASVHKIPEKGESTLRRDARVDRETLLKIITGIENL